MVHAWRAPPIVVSTSTYSYPCKRLKWGHAAFESYKIFCAFISITVSLRSKLSLMPFFTSELLCQLLCALWCNFILVPSRNIADIVSSLTSCHWKLWILFSFTIASLVYIAPSFYCLCSFCKLSTETSSFAFVRIFICRHSCPFSIFMPVFKQPIHWGHENRFLFGVAELVLSAGNGEYWTVLYCFWIILWSFDLVSLLNVDLDCTFLH